MSSSEFVSPSQQDGISAAKEKIQLAYASDLIRECAASLQYLHPVSVTAQMLLHRFYTRVSLSAHCTIWAAGAALLIAGKLADQPRSIRHIANVLYDRFALREKRCETIIWDGRERRKPLDFYGAAGYDWKHELILTERHLLKELGFRLQVELPHKFVLIFVNTLREKSQASAWTQSTVREFRTLLQHAWNYANDAMRLRVCVAEEPEAIACACVSLGISHCNGSLPEGWQLVFGSNPKESTRIGQEIRQSYDLPITDGMFSDYSHSPAFTDIEKTRDNDKTKNGNCASKQYDTGEHEDQPRKKQKLQKS